MNYINGSDISVVIQGPLHTEGEVDNCSIVDCVNSIRKHLNGAEIVVSTWKNEDVSFIPSGCIVIENDDPGFFKDATGKYNNVNRQIVSTVAGIESASRPYILKFRANLKLENNEIAKIDTYDNGLVCERSLFHSKVTVTNLAIRDPAKLPILFHLSDIVQFGKREDILRMWSINLINEGELTLPEGYLVNPLGNTAFRTRFRHFPEQSLTLGWLSNFNIDVDLKHVNETSYSLLRMWEEILVENFSVLDWRDSGILFPKRFFIYDHYKWSLYSPDVLRNLKNKIEMKRYFFRYLSVVFNKYFKFFFSKHWWIEFCAWALEGTSPALFVYLRKLRRRKTGFVHPHTWHQNEKK